MTSDKCMNKFLNETEHSLSNNLCRAARSILSPLKACFRWDPSNGSLSMFGAVKLLCKLREIAETPDREKLSSLCIAKSQISENQNNFSNSEIRFPARERSEISSLYLKLPLRDSFLGQ